MKNLAIRNGSEICPADELTVDDLESKLVYKTWPVFWGMSVSIHISQHYSR